MPHLATNNVKLYFEESGKGQPILLIHGAGGLASLFDPCVALLKDNYHVVSYDRRGCYRSEHKPVHGTKLHIQDAANLIRYCFDQPAIVVGWSAGGTIALHLARKEPEVVKALVLAEPGIAIKSYRFDLMVPPMFSWEFTYLFKNKRQGALKFYNWVSRYTTGGNAFDQYPEEWREPMLNNAKSLFAEIRLGSGIMGEFTTSRQLKSIQCPVTCLQGTETIAVFPPAVKFVKKALPSTKIVHVEGASHMIPTDAPKDVTRAINAAM